MRSGRSTCFMLSFLMVCLYAVGTASSNETEVWECAAPDGTPLFTNKERADCRPMELKPLSVVPTPPDMSSYSMTPDTLTQRREGVARPDAPPYEPLPGPVRNGKPVPDWGRDWHANNTLAGSVQGEVCNMYGEWLRLNEKSRGGFFFGSDPSYGSDPTTRNFRMPSYSFYDNARWVTLARMFGTGFVPIGCP